MDQRLQQLITWLKSSGVNFDDIKPASEDASFRRYFRITDKEGSYIVMDAPPDKEDCRPFIKIADMFLRLGLNVPKVIAQDLQQGFLLLSDLGDTVFLSKLNTNNVDAMYGAAMKSLLLLQKSKASSLPHYDASLLKNELNLFPQWYLEKKLKIQLSEQQKNALQQAFDLLIENALEQPQVYVHRDYHSRNLMINEDEPNLPGVIDFQDAVIGAVTYDLVSLLKDCYISWPREKVEAWVRAYQTEAESLGIIDKMNASQFLRWFDLMGLQRHLKVAGIFSRLKIRDGKSGYLKDIPRTMEYIHDVTYRYAELNSLRSLLREIL